MKRFVIISIDDTVNLIRDYLGAEFIPEDAMPVQFRIHEGRLEIQLVSDGWQGDQGMIAADFDIKRVYGVS